MLSSEKLENLNTQLFCRLHTNFSYAVIKRHTAKNLDQPRYEGFQMDYLLRNSDKFQDDPVGEFQYMDC